MAKVLSVGGLATAGVLMVAGAAVNRLFRPFDATVPRAERLAEPLVLSFPIAPRAPLDDLAVDPIRAVGELAVDGSSTTKLAVPTRPARPLPARLTQRGGSRQAWRCL